MIYVNNIDSPSVGFVGYGIVILSMRTKYNKTFFNENILKWLYFYTDKTSLNRMIIIKKYYFINKLYIK